jgi:hypothetical protein
MKVTISLSPELLEKLEFFRKFGSANMSTPLKNELAEHYKYLTTNTLNINCGTCVIQAMHRVSAATKTKKAAKKKADNMITNTEFDGMNFMKLKSLANAKAKELGIELAKDAKKDELIKILTDGQSANNNESEGNDQASE